jgi:signal transduction histidine kinase
VVWVIHPAETWERSLMEALGTTAAELLPGPDAPPAELQARVEQLATRLGMDIGVFDPSGERLAAVGGRLSPPVARSARRDWIRHRGRDISITFDLPDGRVLVARRRPPPGQGAVAFVALLSLLAVAVALGAWPLVRRLTRRLERLRHRVEDLGRGDLKARAPVEGRDEVADLARSFNRAADRIERLVESQRRVLVHSSHELRSPLARLRVSLEMMPATAEQKERAARDLAELDGLIDEVLEASRLETADAVEPKESVDLLALLAEEAARTGAEVGGESVVVSGHPRLLRRLARNLLENARRHGGDGPVEGWVERRTPSGARIVVLDRGPGVPEEERERIFEPFHRPAGSPETGQGFGLGLSLVRQIARAHGGEARCRGREGGGTAFEVDLSG